MIKLSLRGSKYFEIPSLSHCIHFLCPTTGHFMLSGRSVTISGVREKAADELYVWIHASGQWQLIEAFLQSHRASSALASHFQGVSNYI